jgi:predicted nucleotidyltransferase
VNLYEVIMAYFYSVWLERKGEIREYKPILERQYCVKKIGVFGSYARNEQKDNSDIDILVEFYRPVGFQFINLKIFLEEILNKKVDLVTPNALKPQIKEKILREVSYQ